MTSVAESLTRVRGEMARAAERTGRDPGGVMLVAISKAVPAERVREAIAAGQRDFGENRAQEAEAKHREVSEDVRWHFVGRLQRNKVRRLVDFLHLIHSVDRRELAEEIDRRAARPMEVLVEVNVTGEPGKGGVAANRLPQLLNELSVLPRLEVTGLMTMAPAVGDPEHARPYFRRLAELREDMRGRFPEMGIHHLSMGMSQDYVVAIEEGATIVRVGEAIFGPRPVREQPADVRAREREG